MAAGLSAYGRVLGDRQARAFSAAGILARMPISMTGLGAVLLISIQTGSFGRAGLVTGCATVAGAAAAPLWGRLMDRIGQAPVLLGAAAINALGVAGVILTVLADRPLAITCLAAVVAGLGFSSAGSAVRARWAHRLQGTSRLDTAYAWEAVLDEVVFIVGPVLATFLATTIHPALGLVASLVLGLAGAALLAAQRGTEPPRRPLGARSTALEPLPIAYLVPIVASSLALGVLFGGMEVVIVGFATDAGILAYAGLIVMTWAAGSLVAGLITGMIVWRSPAARRFRIAAVLLGLSMVPLPFASQWGQPWLVAALLLLSGLTIAPTLIAITAATQACVPPLRLAEALGWTTTGLAAGLALGAAILGHLIDLGGSVAGFWGAVGAGALLAASAVFVRARSSVNRAEPGTPAVVPPPAPVDTPLP